MNTNYTLAILASLVLTNCGGEQANESVATGVMHGQVSAVDTNDEPQPDTWGTQAQQELALTATEKKNLVTYRNGEVLTGTVKTQAIFWGKEWSSASYAKDKISGINKLLSGIGNSGYAKIVTEYGSRKGSASANITHIGSTFDSSEFPTGDLTATQAALEVCKMTNNRPEATTVYFVYGTKKAKANICATHGWGTCKNGTKLLMAWFPDIDNASCTARDNVTGNSTGLAALATATAHELMETVTDPNRAGWFDAKNNEIADKCAWNFPAQPVALSTGKFKLINIWSNSAYEASAGQANSYGQKGCVSSAFQAVKK
jgi:hypothetical protein